MDKSTQILHHLEYLIDMKQIMQPYIIGKMLVPLGMVPLIINPI